ncbi:MAG: flavin reductase [Eubacteriales bacterium]|nr:flavin reductase [Eubacteriales bacterium]
MEFKEIKAEDLRFNPFSKIGKDWMLITAGSKEKFNTMTASWGGVGVLWGENVVTTYIRPGRYTKEFVDTNDTFTIAFFDLEYRDALNICGTVSGRNEDKVKKTGLTPYFIDGTVAFQEASMILVCKKMYHDTIKHDRFDAAENIEKWYPEKDYHTMYISKVLKILVK